MTFLVDSLLDTQDADPGDGYAQDDQGRTTLRAAIEECNALGGSNSIELGGVTGTITLSDTLKTLELKSNVAINGSGPDSLIVRRDPNSSVDFGIFSIASGNTCSVGAMTVSNGKADNGGGFANYGTLVLSTCYVNQNRATTYGGGIYGSASSSLQVIGCLVSGNACDRWGGGIYASGTLDLQNTSIDSNTANYSGGGLYSGGTVTATDSSLTNNQAVQNGGGWYNSSLTASWSGGAISNNLAVAGDGQSTGKGGGVYHSGGGSSQLTLDGVLIQDNSARKGGGLYVNDKFVTMTNCTVSGNQADLLGAAIAHKFRSYLTYSFSGGSLTGSIAQDP